MYQYLHQRLLQNQRQYRIWFICLQVSSAWLWYIVNVQCTIYLYNAECSSIAIKQNIFLFVLFRFVSLHFSRDKEQPHNILSEWLALVINFSLWWGGSCCCYCHILFIVSDFTSSFVCDNSFISTCLRCISRVSYVYAHNTPKYMPLITIFFFAGISFVCWLFTPLSNELKQTIHTLINFFSFLSSEREQNNKEEKHNMK